MRLETLTSENAAQYIGYNILYNSRGQVKMATILSVSETGKTISIDDPELKNALQTVTRKIYVILEE